MFYEDGLRFTCTRCSNCCRHDPGYVFLTRFDLDRLVRGFRISERELHSRYCVDVDIGGFTRVSLREKGSFDCIFWNGGCEVYRHRPLQCRSYPFWAVNVESREAWEETAKSCPGVGSGKLHSGKVIERWIEMRRREPFLSVDGVRHEG